MGTTLRWPEQPPACGDVLLRPFTTADAHLVSELSTDPYVPLISSIPATCTPDEALAWIDRQHSRLTDGTGYSFAIADATTGRAVGATGLWLTAVQAGRASAGYSVSPSRRGLGYAAAALTALTAFAWTLPEIHRVELYVEPWNTGSVRTAQRCGYRREGLLASHQEIGGARRDMLLFAAVRPAGSTTP